MAIEAMAIGAFVLLAVGFALLLSAGHHARGDVYERDIVKNDLRTAVELGEDYGEPENPVSPSLFQEAAMKSWRGDNDALEQILGPWFTDDPSRGVAIRLGWVPKGDDPLLHIPVYEQGSATGETVGLQRIAKPATLGPAYVVPRLENASSETGLDVHHVPISKWQPYSVGPLGEHESWIKTQVEYQATGAGGKPTVVREAHTEFTGAPRPATDISFKELPWIDILNDGVGIIDPEEGYERSYRQVVTKEDLTAERTVHLATGGELPEPDAYPHHGFEISINLRGPGAVDYVQASENLEEKREYEIQNAFRLRVDIPAEWSDVEITTQDTDRNDEWNWTNFQITEKAGSSGHKITSFLNVTVTYTAEYEDEPGSPPRFILTGGDRIEAPFFFHARPPPESSHANMGFHEIVATLESSGWRMHETGRLVVEIPTDPGRVHRIVQSHVPSNVPDTGGAYGSGNGIEMPMGATVLNGAEPLDLTGVVWEAPPGTFRSGPKSNEDVLATPGLAPDATEWEINPSGSRLWWNGSGVCEVLAACPVAATVTMDGQNASLWEPWRPAEVVSLYEMEDVQSYADWFVRKSRGWEGVPAKYGVSPGFAFASQRSMAGPGEIEGGFLWRLEPSSSPLCSEEEIGERNVAGEEEREGRRFFDFGPREDGVPVVGDRVSLEDPCLHEAGFEPRVPLVSMNGGRWGLDAVGVSSYRAVEGVPASTFSEWQNGVAESRIVVEEEVVMGESLNASVRLESLFETLQDQGVSEATVRAEVRDPYNAWFEEPWLRRTLVSEGRVGADVPLQEWLVKVECPGAPCKQDPPPELPGPKDAPGEITMDVRLPEKLVPGTHLIVVSVSWSVLVEGVEVEQTGHVVETVDVLMRDGSRGTRTLIEALAWMEDW